MLKVSKILVANDSTPESRRKLLEEVKASGAKTPEEIPGYGFNPNLSKEEKEALKEKAFVARLARG